LLEIVVYFDKPTLIWRFFVAPIVLGAVVIPLGEALAVLAGVLYLSYQIHQTLNDPDKRFKLDRTLSQVGDELGKSLDWLPTVSMGDINEAHRRLGKIRDSLTAWQEGLQRNGSQLAQEYLTKVNNLIGQVDNLSNALVEKANNQNNQPAPTPSSTYNPPTPTVLPGTTLTPNDRVRDQAIQAIKPTGKPKPTTQRKPRSGDIIPGLPNSDPPLTPSSDSGGTPGYEPSPTTQLDPFGDPIGTNPTVPPGSPGGYVPQPKQSIGIQDIHGNPSNTNNTSRARTRTIPRSSSPASAASQPFCQENPWNKILRDLLKELGEGIGQEELENIIEKGGKAFDEALKAREEAIRKDPNFDKGLPDLKKILEDV
jgi:hypothetical protein